MKTDVMVVSSEEKKIDEVLEQVEKVAVYKSLPPRETMSLRLLTEETMGLVRSITGKKEGEFWIEDKDGVYELHLVVNTLIDEERREQLLSVSSSGVNEATRGFMGKIRAFFEPEAGMPVFRSAPMGAAPQMYGSMDWSMEDYREQLKEYREQNQEAREAWDELEKSVVAHVADDVKVSIRGRRVELTIVKKMG